MKSYEGAKLMRNLKLINIGLIYDPTQSLRMWNLEIKDRTRFYEVVLLLKYYTL